MAPRTVTLELTPPCHSCLHEAVCSIRRGIESAPPIEIPMPDAAFALDVVATVTCEQYLPITPVRGSRKPMSAEGRANIAAGRRAAGVRRDPLGRPEPRAIAGDE